MPFYAAPPSAASIPFLPFPLFYAPAKWEAGLGLMSPTGDFFPIWGSGLFFALEDLGELGHLKSVAFVGAWLFEET